MSIVFIVGPGRVGKTLAFRHQLAGDQVHLFSHKSGSWEEWASANQISPHIGTAALPDGARLLFCVQDDALQNAVSEWRSAIQNCIQKSDPSVSTPLLLAHTSGFHDLSVFEDGLRNLPANICVAALHPILTFAQAEDSQLKLASATITALVRGPENAAQSLVQTWGGKWLAMEAGADRSQYHLALSLAANHLTELIARAASHLKPSLGKRADDVVHQLATAALQACQECGPEQALTGPVVRGDLATLKAHWAVLPDRAKPQHLLELEALLQLAVQSQRLSTDKSAAISNWLKEIKKDTLK